MTPMERIEGELSDAQKRIAELEYLLARQAKAAQQGIDAAKAAAYAMEQNASRSYAECNPQALESERAANAALTELAAKLEQERDALTAHVERSKKAALDAIHYLPGGEIKAELRDAYDDTPEFSLARRDLIKQAEVLELAESAMVNDRDAATLRLNAEQLRRQAEAQQ